MSERDENELQMPRQDQMASEMRRTAQVLREEGMHEVAAGNDAIAEYIEGLECGLAAERELSRRRTEQRDKARGDVARLEREKDELVDALIFLWEWGGASLRDKLHKDAWKQACALLAKHAAPAQRVTFQRIVESAQPAERQEEDRG